MFMALPKIDWFIVGQSAGVFFIGFLVAFIPKVIKIFTGKNKKHSIFDITEVADRDLKMQDLLTELRMTYDSSRSYVYLFHNGGQYLDGSPMKKMSMVYESVKRGTSYEVMNSKDVSVSMIPTLTEMISSEEKKLIFIKDMKEDFYKHFLELRNIVATAYCRIMSGHQIVGFVAVDYCNENTMFPECMNDLTTLKQYASCIEVAMSDRFRKHAEENNKEK